MPGSILIAGGREPTNERALPAPPPSAPSPAPSARPTFAQRLLRNAVFARLRGFTSGALLMRDALGEELLGNPHGPLGVVPVTVRDAALWSAIARGGDVGAGEGFVAGQWSCADLGRLLRLFVRDRGVLLDFDQTPWSLPRRLLLRAGQWLRANTRAGSERNIADHYDLGDELFAQFLDPSMTYSAAWFEHDAQSLADAQTHKLRRLCRLVDLQPDERLLEIGSGWGSLAVRAATEFGAFVTTTTISPRQFAATRQRALAAGVAHRVDVLQRDYRALDGTFDKLLSCEMVEAVGARFLPAFLRVCAARLRPGGVLGVQAITIGHEHYAQALRAVDYIRRHVFPGSFIPSIQVIAAAAQRNGLVLEHVEDFGHHYATTLRRWHDALLASPGPFLARGGEPLLRAWLYYFAYCEAGFRERHIGVAHLRFRRR